MLIRYKERHATLSNLCDIRVDDSCTSKEREAEIRRDFGDKFVPRDYYSINFIYFIKSGGEHLVRAWSFDKAEERDKVYNIIMNNYFTDIEGLINDNE